MEQVWKEYQEKNKDRFLDEMLELLRIPSVSAKSEHKEDMQRCADAVRQRLLEAGVRQSRSNGNRWSPCGVWRKNN